MKGTGCKTAKELMKKIRPFITGGDEDDIFYTGFKELDEAIDGFRSGELICIAGRHCMGKTGFILSILAKSCVNGNKSCLYFSLEDTARILLMRLAAIVSDKDIFALRPEQRNKKDFKIPLRKVGDAGLYINDSAYSIKDIEKTCRKLSDKTRIDLVVLDYLQLVRPDTRSDIVNRLKQLARKLQCPVVVLSQLAPKADDSEDDMPMISELKNQGSIDCYADKVLLLYRDDYYNIDSDKKGQAEIMVVKNVSFFLGEITVSHRGAGAFDDISKRDPAINGWVR